MKIAIAAEGSDLDSMVSSTGARAPYFLIFKDDKLVETLSNPFRIGGGGAGFSVAHMLAKKSVDVVVSGRFGPNMENALHDAGVNTAVIPAVSVRTALEKLLKTKM